MAKYWMAKYWMAKYWICIPPLADYTYEACTGLGCAEVLSPGGGAGLLALEGVFRKTILGPTWAADMEASWR